MTKANKINNYNIHTAKFLKMNCTFSRNYCKNTPSLYWMNNPAEVGQHEKLFTWRKNILPKWDLIFVEVRSHLDGMNQFSYKKLVLQSEIHHSAEISLRWDVSPGWDDFSHIKSS